MKRIIIVAASLALQGCVVTLAGVGTGLMIVNEVYESVSETVETIKEIKEKK